MFSAHNVEEEIRRQWEEALAKRVPHVDIRAGDIHRQLGGTGRVPQVCQVMKRLMSHPEDRVVNGPPSGQGPRQTVRYVLPRASQQGAEPPTLPDRPLANDAESLREPEAAGRGLVHDAYGRLIMRKAAGEAFADGGPACIVAFGDDAARARIDGVVGDTVAVEVESRTPKQIRGAVLDLIFHPYPRKLLLVIAGHQNDARQAANQCRYIFERWVAPTNFQVVLLTGNGKEAHEAEDVLLVREALRALGQQSPKD